jgi:phosphatidylglycerophosphate synthase
LNLPIAKLGCTMPKKAFYIINGITFYRAVAAPVILLFIIKGEFGIFKWLLALSFFTDTIDGYLARKFKVNSIEGARLDSIADDLTILAAIIGLVVFKREFLNSQLYLIAALFALFSVQTILALVRYGKVSSFHTYLAKIAAIMQGLSLLQVFFFETPNLVLFYAAACITAIELIEEIVIVMILPECRTNVKGLYWVIKEKQLSGEG